MALDRPFPFTLPGTSNLDPNGGHTGNPNIGGNSQIPQSASIDIPIEDAYPNVVMESFGSNPNDKVELHILSMVDSLLESAYDVPYSLSRQIPSSNRRTRNRSTSLIPTTVNSNINSITVDLHRIFRGLGYISGKFKFQLNFHRNVLGDQSKTVSLVGISPDRTELTISTSVLNNPIDTVPLVDQYGNRIEFYLNLGNNQLFRIASFVVDTTIQSSTEKIYIITLQNPLPDDIGINTAVWVDIQVADPQFDTIVIYPKKKREEFIQLRNPNFGIETNNGFAQSTAFQTWDSLLGSNPTSSQQLINNLISSSFNPTELNIDYRDYSNFVFYSSAEDRLKNFKYKLQLIEYYDLLISASDSISPADTTVTANKSDLVAKKNNILAGFDGYEKYLFYESSSYESSSYGEFTPTTWPKTTSNKPYGLYSVTASQAIEWYKGQLSSASLYDKNNSNALAYLIPEHIRESRNNESYVTFVNMIAQHFDILWSYVNQLTYINSRKNAVNEGLAKDLIYHVLNSLGIDSLNGFKIEELWLDVLGLNSSGSYTQSGSLHSIPSRDISRETWKRILNNLPYLLKTKGTRRGIRALINCYGIPSTVYRIKEYSYPYQYNSNTTDINAQYRTIEKFTNSTVFTTSSYIDSTISNSSIFTDEFRFKASWRPTSSGVTQSLLRPHTGGGTSIYMYPTVNSTYGSTAGVIRFDCNTTITIEGPFYDGNWWYVAGGGDSNNWILDIIQINEGVIKYHFSGSAVQIGSSGNNRRLGYINSFPTTTGFSGSIQEYRFWTAPLPRMTKIEHAFNPQSIVRDVPVTENNYTGSYTNLFLRFPLGSTLQNFDRTVASTTITSIQPNQSTVRTGSATGFQNIAPESQVETYRIWYTNIGDGLDIADKIRIETSALDGDLSSKHSVEKNQYDSYIFDSPKVGIFFSPQDEINEDIADQFSGLSMDNILGDPRDDYEYTYRGLDDIRNHYNKKYTDRNYFWKYVKLIENFDASMFYLIKKFLPARAVKMVGLVIQPTLLERSKIPMRGIQTEDQHLETNLSQLPAELIGESNSYESEVIVIDSDQAGSYDTYDDSIYESVGPILSGNSDSYELDITLNYGALSANVDYINDNTATRFIPRGRFNHMYGGCRISSRGFNIPSNDTFDGQPVVEFWTNNPNNPTNNPNAAGQILTGPLQGRVVTNPPRPTVSLEGRVVTNFTRTPPSA